MAQMKEQIKTPEKELSDKETANLSDACLLYTSDAADEVDVV